MVYTLADVRANRQEQDTPVCRQYAAPIEIFRLLARFHAAFNAEQKNPAKQEHKIHVQSVH